MHIISIVPDRLINRHIKSFLERDYKICTSFNYHVDPNRLVHFEILLIHISWKTVKKAASIVSYFESKRRPVLILSTEAPSSFMELRSKQLIWLEIPFVESALKAMIEDHL